MSGIFNFGQLWAAVRRLPVVMFAIASSGMGIAALAPSDAQAQDYLGEIVATAANYCRRGTSVAEGQLWHITRDTALYSIYGETYGGKGRTTFALPDLRDLNAQQPHQGWGQVRWCVVGWPAAGLFPPRGSQREDQREPGEIMATGANFCPSGWQMETVAGLPHQQTINWCKATGSGGFVNSFIAQMLLFMGDTCPQKTMAAEGQLLSIAENDVLASLLYTTYGGDWQTTFALPNMASPAPGMKWCIVTEGTFPGRD